MRLDSLGYRLLWNFKRLLRFTDWGPAPIILGLFYSFCIFLYHFNVSFIFLGNNNKEFRPPPNLRCLLDLERSKNLDLLINELQVVTTFSLHIFINVVIYLKIVFIGFSTRDPKIT